MKFQVKNLGPIMIVVQACLTKDFCPLICENSSFRVNTVPQKWPLSLILTLDQPTDVNNK